MNFKEFTSKVLEVKEEVDFMLLGRKGKRNAQKVSEQTIRDHDLDFSKGIRETFTHYYLQHEEVQGSISLFISYNTQGKVIEVKTY